MGSCAHLVEFPKPVLLQVLGLQGKEMRVRYEGNPDNRAQMSTWRNGLAQVGRQLILRARRLWGGNELAASLGQGCPEGMGSPGRARGVQKGFNQHSLPPGPCIEEQRVGARQVLGSRAGDIGGALAVGGG